MIPYGEDMPPDFMIWPERQQARERRPLLTATQVMWLVAGFVLGLGWGTLQAELILR